jgi:hypothetical protein
MKQMMHCFSLYYLLDNKLSRDADVAVVACLSRRVNIAPSSPRPGLSRPPPIVVDVIVVARRLSSPPPQIPAARMPRRRLKGIRYHRQPPCRDVVVRGGRATSRRASSTLIVVLVVVVVVDVGATLPPSDGVHFVTAPLLAVARATMPTLAAVVACGCRRILRACRSVVPLERRSPERKRTTHD